MRHIPAFASLAFVASLAAPSATAAQSAILNFPRVSQHARSTQRIGLTDITIDYHRPLVNGRKIFGGLQAYGQVWRAGANDNTTFEVTDPVTIDGHRLEKGVYGLHMIPGESSWIVIFSKNSTSWGSFTYDSTEDALRVTVTPRAIESRDALSYDFDDPTPNSVVVTMRWEKVAASFRIEVNTTEVAHRMLRNQLRHRAFVEWQPFMEMANWLVVNKLDLNEALQDADKSISLEDRFENEITRSRILADLGRRNDASRASDRALALGTQSQIHDFGRGLQVQGRFDEALQLFRGNVAKDPKSWLGHNDAARVAVAEGDFDKAVKEMRLAESVAPEGIKEQVADLVRRLLNHEDINK